MQLLIYPESKCSEPALLAPLCQQKTPLAKLSQREWKDLGVSLVLDALEDTWSGLHKISSFQVVIENLKCEKYLSGLSSCSAERC